MANTTPEQSLSDRDRQCLRLMLAMYKQGWEDAAMTLQREAKRQTATFMEIYSRLLPSNDLPKE